MGAARGLGAAVLAVLLVAARAEAATVWEPIARLSLEGGWDSNALYGGEADRMTRVSPDVGLRLHGPRLDLRATYGGDWITYERLQQEGTWNHRGAFHLDGDLSRRFTVSGRARGGYAFDPTGLAMLGVFRSGHDTALIVDAAFRAEWRATESTALGATFSERTVRFENDTGGGMHAAGIDSAWRTDRRVSVGALYRFAAYQEFTAVGDSVAYSHGVRARARWRATRRLTLEGTAGPALWRGPSGTALVPEGGVQLLGEGRGWESRLTISRGLALGTTALPGIVDAVEAAGMRRLGRRFELRGDGGFWRSGRPPFGRDAVTGFAVGGEAALLVGGGVRLALAGTHFARLTDPSSDVTRTTVGLRLGWELPLR